MADTGGKFPGFVVGQHYVGHGSYFWNSDNGAGLCNAALWATQNNSGDSFNAFGYQNSDYTALTDFGFSVPEGATIDGIFVEMRGNTYGNPTDVAVMQLMYNYDYIGHDFAYEHTAWENETSFQKLDYGGSTFLPENSPGELTPEIVNDPTFGLMMQLGLQGDPDNGGLFTMDFVRMTVYYTEAVLSIPPRCSVIVNHY